MVIIRLFLYAIWISCAPIAIILALVAYSIGIFTNHRFVGTNIIYWYFSFSRETIENRDRDYDDSLALSLLEMIYCIRY